MSESDFTQHKSNAWKRVLRIALIFLRLLWPKSVREHWYFWTLAIPLALLYLLWRFAIAPAATVWGDVGTWVAGLATLGGLVYASRSLQGQTKQREFEALRRIEDEQNLRRAHARQVAVTSRWVADDSQPTRMRVELELVNSSPYPIDGVVLLIPSGGMEQPDPHDIELVVGTVLPGQRINETGDWVNDAQIHFSMMVDCVRVLFTDTWGNHWLRGPGQLEEMTTAARTC